MRYAVIILFIVLGIWACKKIKPSETNSTYAIGDIYTDKNCAPLDSPAYLAYAVFVPNSFTPNGDGLNDLFVIKGKGISDFDLRIYNEANFEIFKGDINNNGWNGQADGRLVSFGVYKFSLKTHESCRNIDHYYSGMISIVK